MISSTGSISDGVGPIICSLLCKKKRNTQSHYLFLLFTLFVECDRVELYFIRMEGGILREERRGVGKPYSYCMLENSRLARN